MDMTEQQIKDNAPDGATHTKSKHYYMSEQYYEWDEPTWYRHRKEDDVWVELLHKPRNLITI